MQPEKQTHLPWASLLPGCSVQRADRSRSREAAVTDIQNPNSGRRTERVQC